MKAITVFACLFALASVVVASPPPAIPATPASVDDVVYIRPFTLDQGFTYHWNVERPQVTAGTLLVLKVDKDLVWPRQVAEPVLYVGDSTAERINHGHESGYVIALVPGTVDLKTDLVWFGTPELPERVDNATVQAEHQLANRAGLTAFSAKTARAAEAKGGTALKVSDKSELLRDEVSRLILTYSPQEKHLVDGFRAPEVKKTK